MRIVAEAAAAYARAGYFAIVDGIILPAWSLQPVCDSLAEAGHPVAYAVLRAPLPVPNVVERLWHDFANLGPLERNAIDVGTKSPDDTANLLALRLRDGSLVT